MKSSLPLLALSASAFAFPQAVTDDIRPKGDVPEGCTASWDGKFEVTIYQGHAKRDLLQKRSCNGEGVLVMTLEDGVLKDAQDRTGYVAENYQFQFDGPPQAGSKYTAGFSICPNGTLALGPSAVFWQCQSGDFYNLYDRHWAEQCEPVEVGIMPCGSDAKDAPKRRVVGSSIIATTVVTIVSDGTTKEVPTTIAVPMCQIGDGQVQVRTTPCDDMELPVITAPPVSQVPDGSLQVPTAAPPAPPVRPQGLPSEPGKPSEPDAPEGDEPSDEGSDEGLPPPGDEPSDESPGDASKKPESDEPSEPGSDEPSEPGNDETSEPAGEPGSPAASEGAAPTGDETPAETDAPVRPAGVGGPAETGEPTGADGPANTGAADEDDEPESLATDSAAAPTRTSGGTRSSGNSPTRAVRPFRSQTASETSDEDEAEETDSDSAGTATDEEESGESASASDAFRILPSVAIVVILSVVGGLMVL
ncbi:hypothetical protein ACJ41O_014602 [Fusarium nematophilum]